MSNSFEPGKREIPPLPPRPSFNGSQSAQNSAPAQHPNNNVSTPENQNQAFPDPNNGQYGQPPQQYVPQPNVPGYGNGYPFDPNNGYGQTNPESPKKKFPLKWVIIAGIAIVAVIVATVVGVIVFNNNKEEPDGLSRPSATSSPSELPGTDTPGNGTKIPGIVDEFIYTSDTTPGNLAVSFEENTVYKFTDQVDSASNSEKFSTPDGGECILTVAAYPSKGEAADVAAKNYAETLLSASATEWPGLNSDNSGEITVKDGYNVDQPSLLVFHDVNQRVAFSLFSMIPDSGMGSAVTVMCDSYDTLEAQTTRILDSEPGYAIYSTWIPNN